MAEAGFANSGLPSLNTSTVLCRYFMHGQCREGDGCRFSHDLQCKPSMVCKYYQRGMCSYGDRCRYDHIKSSRVTNVTRPAPSQSSDHLLNSSRLATLKKQGNSSDSGIGDECPPPPVIIATPPPSEWVNAAEFVPGQPYKTAGSQKSYTEAVSGSGNKSNSTSKKSSKEKSNDDLLCPYLMVGECRYGDKCVYIHGDLCEYCNIACLHPTDENQRTDHIQECLKEHEKDMEYSFAVQRSKDKVCGICMEVVLEKMPSSERRFGLLSDCKHIYCLSCIRKWRSAKQFENKIVRACPECRVPSNFVTPSLFWVEDDKEKTDLIEGYKLALSMKPCKYFKQGQGTCLFAENCFYLHAYPDGTKAEVQPSRPRQRRQRSDGDFDIVQQLLLWEFLQERENRWILDLNFEDEVDFFVGYATDNSDYDSDSEPFEIF